MKNNTLIKVCSTTAIVVSVSLMLLKLFAYFFTGSLIILSSFTDSSLDFLVSFLNFLFMKYSLKPKDEEHRFGHTAIEDLASLLQAGFIGCSACFIIFQSIENIIHKNIPSMDLSGIIVTIIALFFTIALVLFQKYTIKKTNSLIIKSDSLHYISDILMNLGILITLFIIKITQLYWIDPVIAICIAIYIFSSAVEVGKNGYSNIMNSEIDNEEKEKIIKILQSENNIKGYKDLRTRALGSKIFVEFYIKIEKSITVEEAEKISKNIKNQIQKVFENSEITIGVCGI